MRLACCICLPILLYGANIGAEEPRIGTPQQRHEFFGNRVGTLALLPNARNSDAARWDNDFQVYFTNNRHYVAKLPRNAKEIFFIVNTQVPAGRDQELSFLSWVFVLFYDREDRRTAVSLRRGDSWIYVEGGKVSPLKPEANWYEGSVVKSFFELQLSGDQQGFETVFNKFKWHAIALGTNLSSWELEYCHRLNRTSMKSPQSIRQSRPELHM